jgi:hypothetical protein
MGGGGAMKSMLSFLLTSSFLIGGLSAQQTILNESFDGGVFPPTGWAEINNGNSLGWEDSTVGSALHDDFTGLNDNRLVTPPLDLTAMSQAFLHLRHTSHWTAYRGYNLIEVSIDDGLTFGTIRNITTAGDFDDEPLHHDLANYLGYDNVLVSFRYIGDFCNEWSLEEVIVDDVDASTVPRWPNLPTASTPAGSLVLDFESIAGNVPDYMAVNRVDEETRFHSDRAWCNLGQLAPNMVAQGSYSLEMGVDPTWVGQHYYANALVLQLDGSDAGNLWLEFDVMNLGEESNLDDGVFFSLDGLVWEPLLTDWDQLTGGFPNVGIWQTLRTRVTRFDLDTSGLFYLAFAEADNRPYATYDGVAIDNVKVFSEPLMQVWGDGAGFKAWIGVGHCQPGATVELLYSKVGPGPTPSIYGLLSLSAPVLPIGHKAADAAGEALFHGTVPPFFGGTTVWLQAGMWWDGVGIASNPLELNL